MEKQKRDRRTMHSELTVRSSGVKTISLGLMCKVSLKEECTQPSSLSRPILLLYQDWSAARRE